MHHHQTHAKSLSSHCLLTQRRLNAIVVVCSWHISVNVGLWTVIILISFIEYPVRNVGKTVTVANPLGWRFYWGVVAVDGNSGCI